MECIFCKIAARQIPSHVVYEDQFAFAFLDINPVANFHTLVIPKYHCELFHQLPREYIDGYFQVVQKIANAVQKASGWDYNVINNNGPKSGQMVGHVHFHIIPANEQHGIRYGWHVLKEEDRLPMEEVQTRIKDALE